jgi:hypothetical protein
MSPTDPRHGLYAGALQHWRDRESACEPCKAAARRADKRRELDRMYGRPPMVPLGDRAHEIIRTTPRNQLTAATGITSHRLREYEDRGPGMVVRRASRDQILAFRRLWTPIGIQRRLQALSRLGYSMKYLADTTGINLSSLCKLRRNPNVQFVRRTVAEAVLDVWEQLQDTQAPASHSSRETVAEARRRGWVPPIAWDDIDDPTEDASAHAYRPATRAETLEDLLENGAGISEACQVLHVSRASLQKWCGTHGLHHIYRDLTARELRKTANQYVDLVEQVAS